MSRYEAPLTRKFWKSVGGTLVNNFPAVKRTAKRGARAVSALIIEDDPPVELHGESVDITGKNVIVVVTKAHRLSLLQLGEAIVSRDLIKQQFQPENVRTVAICTTDDEALSPIAEGHNVEVVVMPRSYRARAGFRPVTE